MTENNTRPIHANYFLVIDRPYCVWDWNLKERNLKFIRGIDPRYFQYLAELHHDNLEKDDKQPAAMALRIAYHHGIETLLTLLGAALQAPRCVFGWFLRCRTQDLQDLVEAISRGPGHLFNVHELDRVTWESIAEAILRYVAVDAAEKQRLIKGFSEAWSLFAADFLSDDNRDEYNSLKHGFRTKSGGFHLSVGTEDQPGVPAPAEKMQSMGGSQFGSSFLVQRAPDDRDLARGDHVFVVRERSLNWLPDLLAKRLWLIAVSIENVVGALRILNDADPSEVRFQCPADDAAFDEPWALTPGVTSMSFHVPIREVHITRPSKGEILERLRSSPRFRHVPASAPTGRSEPT